MSLFSGWIFSKQYRREILNKHSHYTSLLKKIMYCKRYTLITQLKLSLKNGFVGMAQLHEKRSCLTSTTVQS